MLTGSHVTSLIRWQGHLRQLREVLRKAEFVSLDLELTGLHARSEKFLGVDRCYAAHAEGARNFLPVQLGLCAARRSEEDASRWILTPASVYIFPRDPRAFQATTSTLKFLRDNAFDFNEWISCGVPYTRRQEENNESAALMRRIEELRSLQSRAAPRPSLTTSFGEEATAASSFEAPTEEDRILASSVRSAINAWLATNPQEPLELPVESPLQRLLLHSLVAAEFPRLFSSSSTRGQQRIFAVYTTESQVFEEQLRRLQGELRAAEEARGARELLEAISQERLLVVGHCCFYDFLHLYQSFVEDLPDDVGDFKKKWSYLFPCTFDTKLLAETHEALVPLGTPATLKDLCELMVGASLSCPKEEGPTRPPSFEVEALEGTIWKLDACLSSVVVNCENSHGSAKGEISTQGEVAGQEGPDAAPGPLAPRGPLELAAMRDAAGGDFAHDAGYDSLMTSMVFLMQIGHVLQHKGLPWEDFHIRPFPGPTQAKGSTQSSLAVQEMLSQFVSRVRLVRTQPPSINLGGKDEQQQQQQKRLLLMRNFPLTWQKWNIMKLWSPVWVDVQLVDATTCWLVTRTDEDARSLLTIYEMMPSKDFELLTYKQYRASQSQQVDTPH